MNKILKTLKKIRIFRTGIRLLNIFIKAIKYPYRIFLEAKYKYLPFSSIESIINTKYNKKQYEYVNHNTWYQHGLIIKTYAGFKNTYKLPVSIEHGIHLIEKYPEYEIENNLPSLFVISEHRRKIYSKFTNKKVIAIGPYIHYANSLLSEHQKRKEKKRLGKVLLLFPSHSDVYVTVEHDDYKYIEKIKNIALDFDTIRVCLHWFDVENKLFIQYQNMGWECVCAGHETNNLFMSRLKSIIELSDFVIFEGLTTAIGYTTYLKKPSMIIESSYDYILSEKAKEDGVSQKRVIDENKNDIVGNLTKTFSFYTDKITEDQLQLIDKYWGLKLLKSKSEMRSLILEAESEIRGEDG